MEGSQYIISHVVCLSVLSSSFFTFLFISSSSAFRIAGCTKPTAAWCCSPSSRAALHSSRTCTGRMVSTTASRSTACPSTCRCTPTWETRASWRRRSTGSFCSAERATVCTSVAALRTLVRLLASQTLLRMTELLDPSRPSASEAQWILTPPVHGGSSSGPVYL